ncbi:MAG: APC family permease, partial [Desulfovibrio sp.]|nr:APC family permease [Desulfovibrio sp.]
MPNYAASAKPAAAPRKRLTTLNAWAHSFGCIIGWGCFAMPGRDFLPGAGPLGTLLAVLAGALAMLVFAACYHFMAQRHEGSAGPFAYVAGVFGEDHACLCAWFLLSAYVGLIWQNATAFAAALRPVLGPALDLGFVYRVFGFEVHAGDALAACGVMLLCALLYLRARGYVRHFHTFLAVLLAFGIAACVAGALAKGDPRACPDLFALDSRQAAAMLPLFLLMPWAFLGFESIVHVQDNLAFPRRRLFGVMAASILAAALCYVGMTLLAVQRVPAGFATWQDYVASLGSQQGLAAIPTYFVMHAAFGKAGLAVLEAAVLGALGTSLLGFLISASQLICALSERGVLPEALGRKDGDLPENAMFLVLGLCMTAPFLGSKVIEWFMPVITLGGTLAYGYTSASACAAGRAEGRPLACVLGAAGTALALLLALVLLLPTSWEGTNAGPESHLFLAVWSVLGLFVYRYVARRGGGAGVRGRSPLVWMALFFLIFYCSAMWMRQAGQGAAREACEHIAGYYETQLEALSGHARGAAQ